MCVYLFRKYHLNFKDLLGMLPISPDAESAGQVSVPRVNLKDAERDGGLREGDQMVVSYRFELNLPWNGFLSCSLL